MPCANVKSTRPPILSSSVSVIVEGGEVVVDMMVGPGLLPDCIRATQDSYCTNISVARERNVRDDSRVR